MVGEYRQWPLGQKWHGGDLVDSPPELFGATYRPSSIT
jgi:hypothetical protein